MSLTEDLYALDLLDRDPEFAEPEELPLCQSQSSRYGRPDLPARVERAIKLPAVCVSRERSEG